jgi:hypothetical protein
MLNRLCVYLIGVLCLGQVALAEDQLKVGENAPTSIVAEFFTGEFGLRGSACPVLAHRDAVKVAVFVKTLDDSVVPLIETLEGIVAADEKLKWSFVFVSHENSPTPSQEEWDTQVAQIKKVTNENKIHHLSVGLMLRILDPSGSRAKSKLGFFEDSDVVVMLIRPNAKGQRGVIHFVRKLKSTELHSESIKAIKDEINQALAASSNLTWTK